MEMAHAMYYFALQLVLLFNFHLLSAEGEVLHDTPVKPHIVSGPGRIVDISKKTNVKKDENKEIDNLLHAIYKKFYNDVPKADTAKENTHQQKRQWKDDANAHASTVKVEVQQKKDAVPVKKREDHKIALRELEKTIDKLILSLSDDSSNDNLATKEINKGIKDISKFADLSAVSVSNKDEHVDTVDDDFENFKSAFYKTFVSKEKRQKIVYHGKDGVKEVATQNKDSVVKRQYRDNNKRQYRDGNKNAAEAKSKWLTLDELKKFAALYDITTSSQNDAHVAENNVGGVESFDEFKSRFAKTFLRKDTAVEKEEKRQGLVYHGKDIKEYVAKLLAQGKEKSDATGQWRDGKEKMSDTQVKDLLRLYDELKKQTVAEVAKKDIQVVKRSNNEDKRKTRIEALKNDLFSLFSGQQDASNNEKETKVHSVRQDDEKQIKRRLLTMMRSLEAKLTGSDQWSKRSNTGNDGIENELDSLAHASRGDTKTNKKENNRFLEALHGFVIQSKSDNTERG